MKKFLSLVLALIMTMSLVTISAGATEYKDLTDKDEIQYEEAVAVLNRIGVITGYEDGSFRPETELTRGAAAKIIVSLLIGPEAASNLPNTYAPYPDVPANHTFAGVISYCKTAGIISGYGDGTFKPANSLTGYAFAKMLLGAIGYDSKIQGYTDTGWTMNVARDGNAAGLFNRIEFDGAAAVNREQACQLALNTLKATMVEYSGGLSITAGDAHVTANPTITYKTSNQSYARNISNRKLNTTGNTDVNTHWTVEFGEEHFKDLRLNDEHGTGNVIANGTAGNTARDNFGRPSNEWSYKKVTIGTFPIEPDFVYTTQVIHRQDKKVTDASKVRALELAGYELTRDGNQTNVPNTRLYENGDMTNALTKVADIADYTDNGTKVEVYVDEDDADFINTVVVVKTQLMEVKSVKTDAVALDLYDDNSDADGDVLMGFNQAPIDEDVNDVEVNDDCYDALKDMKAGDIVAVIPVWVAANSKYDVAKVYTPETVSGELTSVDTYGTLVDGAEDKNTVAATVGGTNYKVALWNKDLVDIDGSKVRVTTKDVTLHLDEYGNAMLAEDVGSTSDYIVIGGYHSGLVDGKVVTFVDGWDVKGNELSLNIGNINYSGNAVQGLNGYFPVGNLARYTNAPADRYAEWQLDYKGVYPVASERYTDTSNNLPDTVADRYNLKASNGKVQLNDYLVPATGAYNQSLLQKANDEDVMQGGVNTSTYDNATQTKNVDVDDAGIKVIYVTQDESGEVDSIEIKSGMQAISSDEIRGINSGFAYKRAQAYVNLKSGNVTDESVVKAIVIKRESGSANLSDLVYVSDYVGSIHKAVGTDASTKPVYGYEVHFLGQDNWDDEVTIYTTTNLSIGDFAKARKDGNVPAIDGVTEDNYYRTTRYGDSDGNQIHKALSVLGDAQIQKILSNNKTLLKLMNYNTTENNIPGITLGAAPSSGNTDGLANIAGVFTTDVELDLGGESANNIVSIRKAKIIDLTGNNISDADDLKDLWTEIKDRQTNEHPLINVSLVFNDKWDDDSFRTVYAMIITNVRPDDPEEGGYIIPGSDNDTVAGKLTIKDTDPTGIDGEVTPAAGSTLKAGDKITLTVKSGYEAEAPVADATVVVDGLKYTFTVTEKGAKDGVTITIKKAAAGAVTVASTATDRYGAKLLTVKDGSGASLSPTAGTVMFYAQATAPEWVDLAGNDIATSDITSVTYTIYLNGTPVTSETKAVTVSGASGRNFTLTGATTAAVGFTGTAKIEITDVKYASATVRYVLKDGNESSATPTLVDKEASVDEAMSTGTAADVKIAYNNVKWGLADGAAAANITVVGTKTGAGAPTLATAITGTPVSLVTNYNNTTTYVVADGKGYVDIVIDGLEKKAPTYSFAVDGTTLTAGELFVAATGAAGSGVGYGTLGTVDTGNAAKKLKLTVSKVAGIKGTDTVIVQATGEALATAADTDKFYNYEVQLKINGTWHKAKLNGTTAVTVFAGSLTNDVTLTKDDVKIVGLERIKATDASWAGNTLTITFDKTVKATSGDTVAAGSYTFTANAANTNRVAPVVANVVAEGTTVKVIFAKGTPGGGDAGKTNTDELEAGDVVVIALDKVANTTENADAADKAAKTTITLGASSAATVEVK